MNRLIDTERVFARADTSNLDGSVVFDWKKSLWIAGHGAIGIIGVLIFPYWDAALAFIVLTALTICAGHSVGMHRLLIHRSFKTPRLVEYVLVWLGVLVGMAGPFGMIRAHDMRDWHQRQFQCPAHPAHGAGFWRDAYWQLCCEFCLTKPPKLVIEVKDDRVYRWIERYWMLQQVPLALLLFALGGLPWVVWGISLRIFISLVGHWMVGHFAHRQGQQGWRVNGVAVQGYDLPWISWLTFGENWHGNHHAFPHSAKLGVERGQFDLGYLLILGLEKLGLAQEVLLPESRQRREGLQRLNSSQS